MFNPSPAPSLPLPPRQRLPPRALAGIALSFLTSSLAQLPASRRSRSSWLSTELFLSSLYRFQGSLVVHVVQRKSYYIKLAIVCQALFFFLVYRKYSG